MLTQAAILVLSAVAALMVASVGRWHRWGFVVGLCSQPFWLTATWQAEQWGIFALAVYYTFMWCVGIYRQFPSARAALGRLP